MRAATLAALLGMLVAPSTAMALTATPTPDPGCTLRPDPLSFTIAVEPSAPQIGDEVRVTVSAHEVDGLLFGYPSVALLGAELLFGRNPVPIQRQGTGLPPVTFVLRAEVGGTTELRVSVNYETWCVGAPVSGFRRTVVSPPFAITVLGPTATAAPVCTPPLCADDEVFACPDTCPGGCGTICATRTPTACPTPPCRSDETFYCADTCEGGCGLTCATRTQTPIPTPGCAGDCNADGRVDISELVQGVRAALGASGEEPCLFAFDRDRTETLGINELIAAVSSALTGCAGPADPRPAACRDSGGVVGSRHCCVGVDDFPDTCTNTCGLCPPNATDVVASCACGVDRCFDGSSCVDDVTTRTPTPTFDPRTPTPTPTVDDSVLPCLQTGGTSSSAMCCLGAASFPKTCGVDPCACPLNVSHLISVCDCGPQRCYDPGRGGCVDVIEPVVAGLERVVEQQCTWTSPGPFLREVSVTDQGYAIECDSASGHASHAELVRYESVDQARVAFAYAAMDRERIEFHQLAAAYWSVPINMGRGGGDRYLVWRLGCWVITAHTFDDTDFRIAAQPVPFSEAILAEAGDSLLAECGSD